MMATVFYWAGGVFFLLAVCAIPAGIFMIGYEMGQDKERRRRR